MEEGESAVMNLSQMKVESDDPRWVLDYYDSMSEVLAIVTRPEPKFDRKQGRYDQQTLGSRMVRNNDRFAACTFDEAVEMVKYGWSAARPKLDAILQPVREKLSETLTYDQGRGLDMVGFEPDISLFLEGELECMIDYVPMEARHEGKVFNVVVNVGIGSWADAQTVFAKGAAICALVESFQMLGYDLNIWVEDSSAPMVWGDYDWHTIMVRIHRAGDNLDINKVMFPLGHPGWMRRIMFALREHSPENVRQQFGYSRTPKDRTYYNERTYDMVVDSPDYNKQTQMSRCTSCFEPLSYGGGFGHNEAPGWPQGSHWHPSCCPHCNPKDREVHGYGSVVRRLMTDEMVDASFVISLQDGIGEETEDIVGWVLEQLVLQGVWDGER